MAGQDAYVAPRGQMTARTVGERPAPLEEVAEPQRRSSHGRLRDCPGAVAGRLSLAGSDALLHGRQKHFFALIVDSDSGWYCWVFTPRVVSLPWLAGPDARHHCRYGPDGQLRGEILANMVLMVQTAANCGFPQLQSIKVHRHLLRGSEAHPYHRDSPVARGCGGRCPFVQVVQISWCGTEAISHSPDCCRTKEILQFIDSVADVPVVCPCSVSNAAVEKTAAIPQLQLVVFVLGQGR